MLLVSGQITTLGPCTPAIAARVRARYRSKARRAASKFHFDPCVTLPWTSTTVSPGATGSSRASRPMPSAAQTTMASAAAPCACRLRVGAAASSTVASVRPGVPTHAAGWIMMSPTGPGMAHTLPKGFQGKPVPRYCRSRSNSVQSPARAAARRQPGAMRQTSPAGAAMNSASKADSAGTAKGTSHQYRALSSKMASVIQYRPKIWWPSPNRNPRRAAIQDEVEPAIKASSPGMAISNTGMTCSGGKAAAEITPSANAAVPARQPTRVLSQVKRRTRAEVRGPEARRPRTRRP